MCLHMHTNDQNLFFFQICDHLAKFILTLLKIVQIHRYSCFYIDDNGMKYDYQNYKLSKLQKLKNCYPILGTKSTGMGNQPVWNQPK